MKQEDRVAGSLAAMLSALDEAPGIPGYKTITAEVVREAQRRALAFLAANPPDDEPGEAQGSDAP